MNFNLNSYKAALIDVSIIMDKIIILKLKTLFTILLFIQVFPGISFSGDTARYQVTPEILFGLINGIEISDGRGIYKPGISFQLGADLQATQKLHFQTGFGFEKFKDEIFIPLFLGFNGMLQKDEHTPYLSIQAGYALASNKNFNSYAKYNYLGGLFFSPGFNYKFSFNGKFSLILSVAFKHQFAYIKYMNNDLKYKEDLNFNLLTFRTGFFFR